MSQSPLFELPAELRNDIYRLVLVSDQRVPLIVQGSINPPLLLTSREIRKEASAIYWAENDFCIPAPNFSSDLCLKWQPLKESLEEQHKVRNIRSFCTGTAANRDTNAIFNIFIWLKRLHAGTVLQRFLPPSEQQGNRRADILLIGSMFEMVIRCSSQPWPTLERVLMEQYLVLKVIEPRWSVTPP